MIASKSPDSGGSEVIFPLEKRDFTITAIIAIVFFLMAVWNLGLTDVPTNSWQASREHSFYLDLGGSTHVNSIYILSRDADPVKFDVYTGVPGNWGKLSTFSKIGYYRWEKIEIDRETRYIRFVFYSGRIAEMALIGGDGEKLTVRGIHCEGEEDEALINLIDEQEKVEYPPTYRSQTYFDEIYYVRAAEDYINFTEPYESTHPPLGKLLIAAGILIFGYSPFGWRILGVVFATLMIPAIYIFSKKMFGTMIAAFTSSFLLAMDFMHFTMGRIATVDTFVVFFSLMSHLYFFSYYQGVLKEGWRSSRRPLFLSVLFFSLGFSTKWYTIFGLIGQLFLLIILSLKEASEIKGEWMKRVKLFFTPLLIILDYLIVGALIYILTFVPDMLIRRNFMDFIDRQWGMLSYHSQLTAKHPYSSPWWSWPVISRPVWLYVANLPNGMVSTIASMGNPAIWWAGLFFIILTVLKMIEKRDRVCLFIGVLFLFQWLPYAIITRCLFLYHFYINVPFMILAITYFVNKYWNEKGGKMFILIYLLVTAVFLALFYPVISGHPISYSWKELLRLFKGWAF